MLRASDLIGCEIVDQSGTALGRVRDIRLVQDGPMLSSNFAAFRLHGLRTRRQVYVPWSAVRAVEDRQIRVDAPAGGFDQAGFDAVS